MPTTPPYRPRRQGQLRLVDVFSDQAFRGNPLPVILGAESLTTKALQSIACWMNHSETAFLLPPSTEAADYRVRIFRLDAELSFAGHPTLGACYSWLAAGGVPRRPDTVIQECGSALVPVARGESMLAFRAPPLLRTGPVAPEDLATIIRFLGIASGEVVDAAWADNGPGWVVLLLDSAQQVLNARPAPAHSSPINVGIVGRHPDGSDTTFEIRAFFCDQHGNTREDPVTGSLNASVGQWLFSTGRVRGAYLASQGTALGHAGRIHISQDGSGAVWVGGAVTEISVGSCLL